MNNEIIDSTAVTVIEEKSLIDYEPSVEDATALIKSRQALFKAILTPDDVQMIPTWNKEKKCMEDKPFKKKSYWRKLSEIYKISLEQVKEWREEINGEIVYFFVFRAIAPWGASVEGTGSCSNREKQMTFAKYKEKQEKYNTKYKTNKPITEESYQEYISDPANYKSIHDTRATAETRAKNRAISDLLSFGEVSAEEINNIGFTSKESTSSLISKAKQTRSSKTENKENKEHPNKELALKLNKLITEDYAEYVTKEDFKSELEQVKDGKWKDISQKDLADLIARVEIRCQDMKIIYKDK